MTLVRGPAPFAVLIASLILLLAARPFLAQEGGITATLRGTVTDATGASLPGAQVALTNTGTKALLTAVADDRGAFLFAGLWPATYDLKIELSGFKTSEQRGVVLSPNDSRAVNVQLEIGSQSETVIVESRHDVIQTSTGAREGVITAGQIENLSVISRGALELLRILPGVVAPDQSQLEYVGQAGGVNDTNQFTVNGIRSTRNTVSLDGSGVNDFTCNCGLMVSLNTDMVQDVKVQSSNFAAEYGSDGVSVSAVTKSGTSRYHGAAYWYGRDHRWSANDRSNTILGVEKPKSNYFYPGGNIGGPLPWPGEYNKGKGRLFFWFGLEAQRQMYRRRQPSEQHDQRRGTHGRSERVPCEPRSEPESPRSREYSWWFPRRGDAGVRKRSDALRHATRARHGQSLSTSELHRPGQPLQLRVQRPVSDQSH